MDDCHALAGDVTGCPITRTLRGTAFQQWSVGSPRTMYPAPEREGLCPRGDSLAAGIKAARG